ncbi:uncharacterized protein KY384_005642 [Bacidia gigantensis]|uniref:uncharacterized protein n=1 Tax=Bacidia gigantensis TaxID=2732470 RepID=UPI001D03BE05|nr:uncharacterized protein KY384_005642 [Bacidia gigantensis]KAG8530159.1 hypothetical protein KY384_005642 [Bacidia gigantensis]
MPPFKDEHILIISPGSQSTLAQLGLPESFTPARLKLPTRMFAAETPGEWEPLKVREKRIQKPPKTNGVTTNGQSDVPMTDTNGAGDDQGQEQGEGEDEIQYEEDPTSDEGAEYPIVQGRIVNWPCLFAFLTHIYNTLSPPFHTPVMILSQSCWTAQDHELLTKWFFEKFKIPAFCLMDSALAVSYAFATPNATVVDVGYEKCDVTTISEYVVNDLGKASAVPDCGGEAMTQQLYSLLKSQDFTSDMCEQLKKHPICEILPPGTDLPTDLGPELPPANPAAAVSTGALDSGDGQRPSIAAQGGAPRGPGINTEVGDADEDRDAKEGDDDGVLDVANIVASGKTSEFLARKEREKAERATAKKSAAAQEAAAKQARLPNSKKARTAFQYTERRPIEELTEPSKPATNGTFTQDPPPTADTDDPTAAAQRKEERRIERRRHREGGLAFIRKERTVGVERFGAATSTAVLPLVASTIHRAILSVPEVNRRSELWDSLIIVGNGSKIRGFKEALLMLLTQKYQISPNNATIFTSELPSQFSTPLATGANTPLPQQGQGQGQAHHPPGVNPLLHAATTASLAVPGQHHPQSQHYGNQPSATPTSIKALKPPEYFPEWKDYGMEEAAFLGAQVAAKVVFVVDGGLSKGYMSRTEYNEVGPGGCMSVVCRVGLS